MVFQYLHIKYIRPVEKRFLFLVCEWVCEMICKKIVYAWWKWKKLTFSGSSNYIIRIKWFLLNDLKQENDCTGCLSKKELILKYYVVYTDVSFQLLQSTYVT